MICTNCHHPL